MENLLVGTITFKDMEESLAEAWFNWDEAEKEIFTYLLGQLSDADDGENVVFVDPREDEAAARMIEGDGTYSLKDSLREILSNIAEGSEIHYTASDDEDVWVDCQLITSVHCEGDRFRVSFYAAMVPALKNAVRSGWSPKDLAF